LVFDADNVHYLHDQIAVWVEFERNKQLRFGELLVLAPVWWSGG